MEDAGEILQDAEINYCKISNTLSSAEEKSKTIEWDRWGRFLNSANEQQLCPSGANTQQRGGIGLICVEVLDQ